MAATTKQETIEIKIVFLQEGTRWVAQGVDYDINASGRTIPEAQQEFFWAFIAAIVVRAERGLLNSANPAASLPKAPSIFAEHFEEGEALKEPAMYELPGGLPEAHIIRAVRASDRRIYQD